MLVCEFIPHKWLKKGVNPMNPLLIITILVYVLQIDFVIETHPAYTEAKTAAADRY